MHLVTKGCPARTRPASIVGLVSIIGLAAALVGAPSAGGAVRHKGPVDVLYAGSLVGVMEQAVGPAFEAETGYTFSGFAAGSTALANAIKGGTELGDVFVSASPAVNASLEGSANGNWVSWYARFASSPLVIGYNSKSPFAADLKSKPWYQVITEPRFLLGRTDPATDPKGSLAVQALTQAATTYHDPALEGITSSQSGVFAEQSLVGLLQAGQLDAGFFYASEASAAGIPTVPLGAVSLAAQYTVTVLNHAPDVRGGRAFVQFLFSRLGRALLEHDGLSLVASPDVSGPRNVPQGLRAALHVR